MLTKKQQNYAYRYLPVITAFLSLQSSVHATTETKPLCSCQCPYAKTAEPKPSSLVGCEKRKAFVKIMSGASFTQKAHIFANPSFWDPAVEGYNSRLKTGAIFGAGIGYEFYNWLSGDVSIAHRWGYKYKKFQTTVANPGTPFALPNKTRHFDLDSTSIMFNARVHGRGINGLYYTVGCDESYIAPFIGGGLGFSYHRVRNFYSKISPTALTGSQSGTSSIGSSSSSKTALTYQFEAGLEYKYKDKWGFSTGYRWFDAGKFKGPNNVIAGTGLPGSPIAGTTAPAWKGRLRAHEVFAELSYYFH